MRTAFMLILIFATLTLAGCTAVVEPNQTLVGTWFWDEDNDWQYVFNYDGTGIRGWYGTTSSFTWGASDTTLRIRSNYPGSWSGPRTQQWTYEITGDVLRLTSRQARNMTYEYIRAWDTVDDGSN